MVRDLASLYILTYYSGGDTSGMNYASLKSSQFQNVGLSSLYNLILNDLQRNIDIYLSIQDSDFSIGELV